MPPNRPPVINWIDGARRLHAGDSADYFCNASDPEGKQLDYHWRATVGTLRFSWGRTARWYAPDSADTAWLAVTVSDDGDSAVTDSFEVVVMPDTETIVWWDGAVRAGEYLDWSDTVRAGYRIAGYSTTVADTIGEVYLMVFDEGSFQRWAAGEPAVALLRRIAYRADSFSVRVPVTDQYRIVIDNTLRAADYNYWLWVFSVTP